MLLVNGFHELILLHQVSLLCKKLFCPETKLLGLSGSTAEAEVYHINPISTSSDFEITVPVWCDLKAIASAEQVASLTVPEQNPSVSHGKNSLLIPPLVLNLILEAKPFCPVTLIPILPHKLQEFDHASTQEKAFTLLCPVLEFLWAAYKKIVPPTIIAVD